MASSTLRCTHAKCDLCFSQNLLPTARTMSATSRVGRLIASSASGSASLRRAWTSLWLPVGWESLTGGAATVAVNHRVFKLGVSEKDLDGAQIGAGLQHVGGKAMSTI